jgi:toxin CcdB
VRQFDVYENPSVSGRAFAPYVVVLSSHLMLRFDDAIVAPLINDAVHAVPELELAVTIAEEPLTLVISELSTVRQRVLKRRVGSLLDHEFDIRRALDRLFTGF